MTSAKTERGPTAPKKPDPRGSGAVGGPYERYGLTGNPFRDLASENLEDVEIFHVDLAVDESLATMKEEAFARENRALVVIIGQHGAGKTERLLLAAAQARARGAFVVYHSITDKLAWVLPALAQQFLDSAQLGGLARLFSAPSWYRNLLPLTKHKDGPYDAVRAGRALAAALNARAPAFLLLNDLHNLAGAKEADLFAKTLQELSDAIRPGVFVMLSSLPAYFVELTKTRPTLASRINRTVALPTLAAEEVALLLAKKLLAKRLVENLDPLYPFDRESVAALTTAAYGNPRRVLELADRALEYAANHRAYRVDPELVQAALTRREPDSPAASARPETAAPSAGIPSFPMAAITGLAKK